MKKIGQEYSSIVKYVFILISVFALALFNSNFRSHIPFYLLATMRWEFPIFLIGALFFLLMNKTKRSYKDVNRKANKVISNVIVSSLLITLILDYIAPILGIYPGSPGYTLDEFSLVMLYLAYVLSLILINKQKFVYWPFWNRQDKDKSDERQHSVRQRVYEKAYGINLLILLAIIIIGQTNTFLYPRLAFVALLCLFGMPAIIAAWQKDS